MAPAPSDVHDTDGGLYRVVEHHRRTVGHQNGHGEIRRGGHQRIARRHARLRRIGPPTPVLPADNLDPNPMHLAGHHQVPEVEAQVVARDLAVGDNARRVVPHLEAQVEAGQLAFAHAALTPRDRSQHLGPVKA